MQYTEIFLSCKNENFISKNSDIFINIFAQNIEPWYTLTDMFFLMTPASAVLGQDREVVEIKMAHTTSILFYSVKSVKNFLGLLSRNDDYL